MPTFLAETGRDETTAFNMDSPASRNSGSEWECEESEIRPTPRVLFVASSAGEGGIERHSVQIAKLLIASGVDVTYACGDNSFIERQCRAQGIHTETIRSRNSGDPRGIRQLSNLFEDLNPDIVHVHSRRDFVPTLLGVFLLRLRSHNPRRPRVLIHSHLDKPLGMPARLSRRLFSSVADGVIAVSGAVKRHLIEFHGFAPSFIRVLYNGIDVDAFLPVGTKAAYRQRLAVRKDLGIPSDALILGMVGRLDAKGQAELISAAAPVVRARRGLWIVLVGPEGTPGDMDRLRELAETEGISARVIMTGARDDVPSVLPAFDLLVHLPDTESFGLALVEAMASGIATVTTDVGGCSEVVENGVTGIVVPPNDGIAIQAAVKKLLVDDGAPGLRQAMGAEGRKRASQNFSLEHQVQQLAEWYQEYVAR